MNVLRNSAKNWNKFGWYDAIRTEEIKQTSTVTNFDCSRKYKYSVFNIKKNFDDVDIIWNTASESIVVLNQEEKQDLENYLLNNSNGNISLELLQKLFELGILVFDEDEEFAKFHFIRKRATTATENVKNFIISPTTQCNARCFYCFAHEDTKTNIKMTFQTADEVLQYIYSQLKPNDKVVFHWFGGEPLMATDIIDYIIHNFNDHFKNTIQYNSKITSNGSLLTDDLILKAKGKWHLKKIQITLDGFQSEHDNRKNYQKKDKNQYELVLLNIEKLLDNGIYTNCRLNLDHQNVENLDRILNDLGKFKNYNHFSIHAKHLQIPENSKNIDDYIHYTEYNKFYSYIYGLLIDKGFVKNISEIIPNRMMSLHCTAILTNFPLINSDGNLFRCVQEVHNHENCVGNCKTGIIHNHNLLKWLDTDVADECRKCKFLPICQGGCKFERFRNDKYIQPCFEHKYISNTLMNIAYEWHCKKA